MREEINVRSRLCIEEETQARIKEIVDLAVDQAGWRLFEMIIFEIESSAQPRAKIVLKSRDRECAVESIEKIIELGCLRCAGEKKNAERMNDFHSH